MQVGEVDDYSVDTDYILNSTRNLFLKLPAVVLEVIYDLIYSKSVKKIRNASFFLPFVFASANFLQPYPEN